jgi:hypothetical protein
MMPSFVGLYLIAGGALVAQGARVALSRSDHAWARSLSTARGTQMSRTRRRVMAVLTAVVWLILALTLLAIADRRPMGTTWNSGFSYAGLVVFFFAIYTLYVGFRRQPLGIESVIGTSQGREGHDADSESAG